MDIIQQIIAKIAQVSSILIIVPGQNGDALASGLALRAFLRKLEKEVVLLSPGPITPRFDFLPGIAEVTNNVDLTKSFVIDLSTKKSEVAELSYWKESEHLSIYLKPKKGEFTAQDVSFRTSNFPYELVIVIGVPSLEQLGDFYNQNTALFFETPIVNIDYRPSNENYAPFNLILLAATSCSEILLDLINKFESSLLDEDMATQLLAGIIGETNSFQHVRTTPQTFLKASQLVSLGAKQQEIIAHLYKSKSLGLLKLWGRALARLRQETEIGLVYTAVNEDDVQKSQASPEDTQMIIKEMISQLAFAKILLFLKEEPIGPEIAATGSKNQTTVYCHAFIAVNLPNIFKQYAPIMLSAQTIKFMIPDSLVNAENQTIALIKNEVGQIRPAG